MRWPPPNPLRFARMRWPPPNPLRSEASAFGCVVWVVSVLAVVVAVVLIVRALT